MGTLKDFEAVLFSRPGFIRAHRSYIANILQAECLSSAELLAFRDETLSVFRALRKEAASQ